MHTIMIIIKNTSTIRILDKVSLNLEMKSTNKKIFQFNTAGYMDKMYIILFLIYVKKNVRLKTKYKIHCRRLAHLFIICTIGI